MRKKGYVFIGLLSVLILLQALVYSETIALVGGTVIDVSGFGNSFRDIYKSVVLIEGDRIAAVGDKRSLRIPEEAKIVDLKGKYVLPGLVDGFAALDNQSYANCYLFMGITSIVGIYGGRRAPLFEGANPCPDIYRFGYVGEQKATYQEIVKRIEAWAEKGVKFLLLHYELRPEQTKIAIEKAHEA